MGSIYINKNYVGHCEDGVVYRGSGKSNPIGRYEGGNIYNQFREHVGSYSGGSIYNKFNEHIASYESGIVYNKYLNFTVGKDSVGTYDGDPAGAAALVLLFLGETVINSGNSVVDSNGDESYSVYTASSSGESTGFFSSILVLIGSAFVFLFVKVIPFLFVEVIPFALVYFWIPIHAYIIGVTLWVNLIFCCLINICTGGIFTTLLFGILNMISLCLFIVYYICVISIKIMTKCSREDVLKMFCKWFLKGPFAFPTLIGIMTENNIMPRITKIANKIIDFLKKKFPKKEKNKQEEIKE